MNNISKKKCVVVYTTFQMNNSTSESQSELIKNPYDLLTSYGNQAKIKSKAYGLSEEYYRNMHKYFTYPLILLTCISSALAVLELNRYILIGLNLGTIILISFDKAISPKNKEHESHQISLELGEIARAIKQFINSNNRTKTEIKSYSQVVLDQMNIWLGIAPPCKEKFIKQATQMYAKRHRVKSRPQKKEITIDVH
jgi:hypothetical protein